MDIIEWNGDVVTLQLTKDDQDLIASMEQPLHLSIYLPKEHLSAPIQREYQVVD